MPLRFSLRLLALLASSGAASIGCNATCIRDSDCLGKSVCSENRCILVEGRDSGAPGDEQSNGGSGGGDGAGGSSMTPAADAGD